MANRTNRKSFAGGEITEELIGRVDLAKHQTGLALVENFIVLPHGPITRRPGTQHINEARDSTGNVRLIPFQFSATQSAVVELGHQYARFHVDGATVVETGLTITGVSKAIPGVLSYTGTDPSNGDWMYLSGIVGMTELNGRWVKVASVNAGANTFSLTDLWNANIDTSGFATYASGGTAERAYALATPYDEADLFSLVIAQQADVVTITHPGYATAELSRLGAANWSLTAVAFAPSIAAPGAPTATPTTATAGVNVTHSYVVTAVASDGITESIASAAGSCSNDLSIAGNLNTITWSAVAGAAYYYVYKKRGGGYGYIGRATGLSAVDDNIIADTLQSPPDDIIDLNSGANDYPSCVAHHEQRRWFGGTNDKPQVLWATRTGADDNLTSSIPSRDADAMELRIAANQYNQVRHLVPFGDLFAFTGGAEFRIFADGAPAITPTSLSIKPIGYSGASTVAPVVTPSSILYAQAKGCRVRELAYGGSGDSQATGYRTIDVSILATGRFDGFTIREMAFSKAPDSVLWAVRSDGALLGMTYIPEQQVYGWAGHSTNGLYESVCVVGEQDSDVLYAVVKRVVDGRAVRYIERMNTRLWTDQKNGIYLDSALSYDGTATTTLTGLWHLEGATVDILADGAVHPAQTVVGGSITLEQAASVVHVGFGFVSRAQTLPLSIEAEAAQGQGRQKNVNTVHIRVKDSVVVKAGPAFDRLAEYPARDVLDPYGSPPAVMTGELDLPIDPSWSADAPVCIEQSLPLPLTVLSMSLEFQAGG